METLLFISSFLVFVRLFSRAGISQSKNIECILHLYFPQSLFSILQCCVPNATTFFSPYLWKFLFLSFAFLLLHSNILEYYENANTKRIENYCASVIGLCIMLSSYFRFGLLFLRKPSRKIAILSSLFILCQFKEKKKKTEFSR